MPGPYRPFRAFTGIAVRSDNNEQSVPADRMPIREMLSHPYELLSAFPLSFEFPSLGCIRGRVAVSPVPLPLCVRRDIQPS